eukprot:COSAG02_NODE_1120_length_14453_cov_511.865055_9_plen_270_part_00
MVTPRAEEVTCWIRAVLRESCPNNTVDRTLQSSLNASLWALLVSMQAALRESPLPVGWKTAAQSALRMRLRSKHGQSGNVSAILDAMCAVGGSIGPGLLAPVGWRRSVQRLGLRLSARQCDEVFKTIDTNNDSAVDLHELLAWLNGEQGTPVPIVKSEHSQMSAVSVSQERATEEAAAAVATLVREQFGGSAETAFLYLLEVTPGALNHPDKSQVAQNVANLDDSDPSESEMELDESVWTRQQQQQEQKDRCGELVQCIVDSSVLSRPA